MANTNGPRPRLRTRMSAPRLTGYVERLEDQLNKEGYRYPLLLAHCMGGLTTMEEVRSRPLLTLDSGPVSGVLGARFFGAAYGEPNIICADMGGTTFDVSLIESGRYILDDEPVVDRYTCLIPESRGGFGRGWRRQHRLDGRQRPAAGRAAERGRRAGSGLPMAPARPSPRSPMSISSSALSKSPAFLGGDDAARPGRGRSRGRSDLQAGLACRGSKPQRWRLSRSSMRIWPI